MDINSRVAILEKPLYANQINILNGSVVDVKGNVALVQVDDETFPREFPLSELKSQEETYGAVISSNYDNIIDAIRR